MKALFLLVTLLFCFETNAKRVLIGFGDHPHVDYYKGIVENSYQQLGYEVLFTELVNERRLVALNAGIVDAIVIATSEITGSIDNIRRVEHKLTEGTGYLLCQKHLPCGPHVFKDSDLSIVSTQQAYQQIKAKYLNSFAAKLMQFERHGAILELLAAGRADYGFYYVDTRGLPNHVITQFNYSAVSQLQGYHYIHKRLERIIEDIKAALITSQRSAEGKTLQ